MTADDHRMLSFLIYDMCKRTRQIEKQFHASTERGRSMTDIPKHGPLIPNRAALFAKPVKG